MNPYKNCQGMAGNWSCRWIEAGHSEKTLILLHGIGSTAQSWISQILAFSKDYRVIAWHAPGYGQSDPLTIKAPIQDDYVRVLLAFLDMLHIHDINIVGHSLGAIIATHFAVSYPNRVKRLILSSPAGGYDIPQNEALSESLQQRIDDIRSLGPAGMAKKRAWRTVTDHAEASVIQQATEAMSNITIKGYEQAVNLLGRSNLRGDLDKLQTQTVPVLCGVEDRITPFEKVEQLTQSLKGRYLLPIPNAGHASYLECPEAYNQALQKALTSEG